MRQRPPPHARPAPPALPVVVVALGGNALIRPGEEGTPAEQAERVSEVAGSLLDLAADAGLVITHGNGPQVGRHLLRSDLLAERIPPTTIELAVAATQGEIGWTIQQALDNQLRARGQDRDILAVITRVRVDRDDPAFHDPRKFVGGFMDRATAEAQAAELGWRVRQDGDRGWRRVVPSPVPRQVLEADQIASLCQQGTIVIAAGGGGIPVVELAGRLAGVEAVVDKDRASALLATQLGAERLVILTAVDQVWRDFGTPQAKPLGRCTPAELTELLAAGQFPAGSMKPKIEAALAYLADGGGSVLITSPENLAAALRGDGGTLVAG